MSLPQLREHLLELLDSLESTTCGSWQDLMWTTEMQSIQSELVSARMNVQSGQLEAACLTFLKLGIALGEWSLSDRKHKDRRRELGEKKRTAVFQEKTERNRLCREAAQAVARITWDNDLGKDLNIRDVTEEVAAFLENSVYPHLEIEPRKPATVRNWVKEVAPSYASKPGRPKKNPK